MSFQSTLAFISCRSRMKYWVSLLLQLMKATALAESSFIFSPGSLQYADVYRRESGRCRTLPFFLTFFYYYLQQELLQHICDDFINIKLGLTGRMCWHKVELQVQRRQHSGLCLYKADNFNPQLLEHLEEIVVKLQESW